MRTFLSSLGGKLALSAIIALVSAAGGWTAHALSSTAPLSGQPSAKACRDEVVSVDNARGPASCSLNDMTGELKDGYLICRCKKK